MKAYCLLATDGIGVRCPLTFHTLHGLTVFSGPILMTVGPWKPISLHSYVNRIVDLHIRSIVSESLDVKVTVDFSVSAKIAGSASIVLKDPDGSRRIEETDMKISSGRGQAEFFFSAGVLDLWYPVGYGKQPIYTAEVQITDEVNIYSKL